MSKSRWFDFIAMVSLALLSTGGYVAWGYSQGLDYRLWAYLLGAISLAATTWLAYHLFLRLASCKPASAINGNQLLPDRLTGSNRAGRLVDGTSFIVHSSEPVPQEPLTVGVDAPPQFGVRGITGQERQWALAVSVVTLLVVQLPYVVAYLTAPPHLVFSGALANIHDVNSYLAEIRMGMGSSWLFHDLYTPEPHPAGPLFLFYTGLGKGAAILGLAPDVIYALARPVCGLALLATLYWFLTILLAERQQRQIAFLLLCFSSGLGWLLLLFGEPTILGEMAPDLWVPEAITFLTLLTFPHFALATTLILIAFGGLLIAFHTGRTWPALGAALACFAQAWLHPFNLAVIYAVMAAYLAWLMTVQRRLLWQQIGQFAFCLVLSLPVVLYLQFGVIAPNPVFQGWMEQNIMPSPNPLACIVGYGLLLPLALLGAARIIRASGRIDPFPLLWMGVGMVLLYLPFDTQRRFLEGMHIPICVLAALGWSASYARLRHRRICAILVSGLLLAGLVTSNAVNWASSVFIGLSHRQQNYIYDYDVEAFAWLANHSQPTDTVLSSTLTGSFLPAWAGNRVVSGHWAQTINLPEKQKRLQQFFDISISTEQREAIIEQYGVIYLFYGPNEQELGPYNPSADPLWCLVFDNGRIAIYRTGLSHCNGMSDHEVYRSNAI
jgi:hypothetical protein